MAEYIEYHPLKFWLDPASIAEIVAHIQTYLVNNPINSTTEIETIIHDYLIAHPELIGGVDSVNGLTGEVVLTADNISAGENVTIKDVLDSLQDQIDDIVASIPSDYQQLIDDVSNLKSTVKYNHNGATNIYESQVMLPCDNGGYSSVNTTYKVNNSTVEYSGSNSATNLRMTITGNVTTGSTSNPTYSNRPDWFVEDIPDFIVGHTYYFGIKLLSGTLADGADVHHFAVRDKANTLTKNVNVNSAWTCTVKPQMVAVSFGKGTYTDCVFYVYIVDLTASNVEAANNYMTNALIPESGLYKMLNGGYSRAGSVLGATNAKYYLITGDYVGDEVKSVIAETGYKLTLIAFSNNSFAGFLGGENIITSVSTDSIYWTNDINFEALRLSYPSYQYKIELTNDSTASGTNSQINETEASNLTLYTYRDVGIKPYFKAEMAKVIADSYSAISEKALVFPVVTDIHFMSASNLSTLFNNCADNIKHLCKNLVCDFAMNLGDNTDGNKNPEDTIARNKYMESLFAKIGVPYYMAIGNHDTNDYDTRNLTGKETFTSYLANTKGVVFDTQSTAYHFNYYKDFDELGVRLLVLDVNYLDTYRYAPSTAQWLTNVALDTSNMVLLCEHLSSIGTQNWNGTVPNYGADVTSALHSFVNNGGTLIQLCGHSHADYYFNDPWLVIFSCCQKFEQVDTTAGGFLDISGNIGGNAGIVAPARVLGSATEDLWNVCVLKPLAKEIDFIRFGAGVDRYFHFGKTVIEGSNTLTTMLGTVTWSTSDSSVATVSDGTVTAVGSGLCQITATDDAGNFETWTVSVA